MSKFCHLLRLVLIHLLKNCTLWLNAFPAADGVSSVHSPRFLLTGRELSFDRHAVLEFGSYAQTHEEHSNGMEPWTMGTICLAPTGNAQGGHWFLSLTSGSHIICHRWTPLPMPQEVVHRITQIGHAQAMPSCIMYANRCSDEISDRLEDFFDDSDTASTDSEDDTYIRGTDDDASFVSDDETTSTSSDDDDDLHDNHDLPDPETPDHTALLPPGDEEDVLEDDDGAPHHGGEQDVIKDDDSEPPAADDNEDHIPFPDATQGPVTVTNSCQDDDSSAATPLEPPMTEHDRFMAAEEASHVASDLQVSRRHVSTQKKTPTHHYGFLTEQMSTKKGLRQFGQKGADVLMKELQQLIDRRVMHPRDATTLSHNEKHSALKYLMFLKEKRCGKVKGGRGCANGRKQWLYKSKEETSSPTVRVESLFLSSI